MNDKPDTGRLQTKLNMRVPLTFAHLSAFGESMFPIDVYPFVPPALLFSG